MREDEGSPFDSREAFEETFPLRDTQVFVLRLYVAGNAPRSQLAVENVRRVCDEYLSGRCELEIIDIYQNPGSLTEDLVLAAPTLIRRLPLPLRRVVGDMSQKEKLLVGLELVPRT